MSSLPNNNLRMGLQALGQLPQAVNARKEALEQRIITSKTQEDKLNQGKERLTLELEAVTRKLEETIRETYGYTKQLEELEDLEMECEKAIKSGPLRRVLLFLNNATHSRTRKSPIAEVEEPQKEV